MREEVATEETGWERGSQTTTGLLLLPAVRALAGAAPRVPDLFQQVGASLQSRVPSHLLFRLNASQPFFRVPFPVLLNYLVPHNNGSDPAYDEHGRYHKRSDVPPEK
jgi:hypothetical protein